MDAKAFNERYAQVERDYADYFDFVKQNALDSQFPHCDSFVLHVDGVCEYCDRHPDWQEARRSMGIAFTGEIPGIFQRPCPATVLRTAEKIHRWHGNAPMTAEQNKEYYEEYSRELDDLMAEFTGSAKIENIKVHDHVLTAEEIIKRYNGEGKDE